jgi:predicted unusual protein kinase regulating ubiquinone biosynthesis (AarF/ABC1/UbiB family)
LRRKLPRYHWRPPSGIRSGEALADLQRICLEHGIRLPPSFALVGKTLAQADSIARTLDPIALIEEESLELMLAEAESRLESEQLFSLSSCSWARSRACRGASRRSSTGSRPAP